MIDIKEICINATYQHYSGVKGATALAYNDYFYYIEIITNNNYIYYLTSLLGYNLDTELKKSYPNLIYKDKIKAFPYIGK